MIEERFDAKADRPVTPRYDIAPSDDLAVVRNDSPETIDPIELDESDQLDLGDFAWDCR